MSKAFVSYRVESALSSVAQASGGTIKMPNRKPERDHMDGLLKMQLNKCL